MKNIYIALGISCIINVIAFALISFSPVPHLGFWMLAPGVLVSALFNTWFILHDKFYIFYILNTVIIFVLFYCIINVKLILHYISNKFKNE
jgi:hypothetical protein